MRRVGIWRGDGFEVVGGANVEGLVVSAANVEGQTRRVKSECGEGISDFLREHDF